MTNFPHLFHMKSVIKQRINTQIYIFVHVLTKPSINPVAIVAIANKT